MTSIGMLEGTVLYLRALSHSPCRQDFQIMPTMMRTALSQTIARTSRPRLFSLGTHCRCLYLLQRETPLIRSLAASRPQYRTYAQDEKHPFGGSTSGDTNIRHSPSADPQSASVNAARSTSDKPTPDNAAASRQPVSQPVHANVQDEETPGHSNVKRPPEEPDHVKRAHVEKEGRKPLDPADK